jgi:shikimate dehydrogenase
LSSYGLIGYPLGHSFSPSYFREKFNREGIEASYQAFQLKDISELPVLLKANPDLKGLNVTIPYKEAVLPYLDVLYHDAAAIGAVNCISIESGKLTGYNTDWKGFADSLESWLQPLPEKALVLGTGGASKAVVYALRRLGLDVAVVSRKGAEGLLGYGQLTPELVEAHPLVVNTTPLGTAPQIEEAPPFPYSLLAPHHALYDLVYNPSVTRFMLEGIARGTRAKNGHQMLVLQAEASWSIWNPGHK